MLALKLDLRWENSFLAILPPPIIMMLMLPCKSHIEAQKGTYKIILKSPNR